MLWCPDFFLTSTDKAHNRCVSPQQHKSTQLKERYEKVVSLRLLVSEADYVRSVLEDSLEEVRETGTYSALQTSVNKSRKRNREKAKVG